MTEEQIEKGQELLKLISKYKGYLETMNKATDYYSILQVKGPCMSGSIPHIIPFEECKARTIYSLQQKLKDLQNELDNL